MNKMSVKGHAGGTERHAQVTKAAMRHDGLSVFTCQSVPPYFMSFSFSLTDLVLDVVS